MKKKTDEQKIVVKSQKLIREIAGKKGAMQANILINMLASITSTDTPDKEYKYYYRDVFVPSSIRLSQQMMQKP